MHFKINLISSTPETGFVSWNFPLKDCVIVLLYTPGFLELDECYLAKSGTCP
jgi:hypothetical protein